MRGTATLALALTLASPAARAEPVAASLAWVRGAGADGCAGAEVVRARIATLLGYDPAALPAPARSVEVTVTRGETWRAALYVRDAAGALLGERVLESPDARCDAVVGAVAFAVATALDAEVVRPPEPAPPAAPECPAPAPCPSCPAPDPPRPRRAPRWRVNAEVSAGVLVGALPEPALELSLRVSARPPSWPWLYADLGWSPEVAREVAGGRTRASLASGALGVCPFAPRAGSFEFRVCAGARAGLLRFAGEGFARNAIEERPWVSLEAGLRVRWDLARIFHLTAGVEAAVPLVRDTVVVEGAAEVHRASVVGLRGTFGVGMHFE